MSAIRKTQLNFVAAAYHVCTVLDTVAKLLFNPILSAVLCKLKLSLRCVSSGCTVTSRPPCIKGLGSPPKVAVMKKLFYLYSLGLILKHTALTAICVRDWLCLQHGVYRDVLLCIHVADG